MGADGTAAPIPTRIEWRLEDENDGIPVGWSVDGESVTEEEAMDAMEQVRTYISTEVSGTILQQLPQEYRDHIVESGRLNAINALAWAIAPYPIEAEVIGKILADIVRELDK